MSGSKTLAERSADWLWEASVLVAAFGWLERAVKGQAISAGWGAEIFSVSAAFLLAGAAVDHLRRPK